MAKLIKYLIMAITMSVAYGIVESVRKKSEIISSSNDTDKAFTVKPPSELSGVYATLFATGIVLFLFFLFLKMKGVENITKGNFIVALVVAGIGLFVAAYSAMWRMQISANEIEIHRLLHRTQVVHITDVDAQVGSKGQIIIYDGKHKVVTVDSLTDNFDKFTNVLKANGKL